jgi:hypothetical protein
MKQERFNKNLGDFSPPSRRLCDTCKVERIFQNYKCLTCGVVRERIPLGRGLTKYTTAQKLQRYKLYKQCGNDRTAYFKRQAEESRKKFEGSK